MSEVEIKNVQPHDGKPHVSSSALGYWVICVQSYDYEGEEIPKGRMSYHTSIRPIMNNKWRRATPDEVDTKQNFKGNWFNLKTV